MEFQRSGKIEVGGHELSSEDLRIIYSFDGNDAQKRYEAHSDGDVSYIWCSNESLVTYPN